MHCVYILYSPSGYCFNIGYTGNLEKRIRYHNTDRSPCTKGKDPWHLVRSEEFVTATKAVAHMVEVLAGNTHVWVLRYMELHKSARLRLINTADIV